MTREEEIIRDFELGNISISEAFQLLSLEEEKYSYHQRGSSHDNFETAEGLNLLLAELDSLIGLEKIKKIIKEYIAFVKIQNVRRDYGLRAQPVVMHMIFKGNPGTGKTTIARILAKIFKELKLLEKGHLVEAERADLVGEYIGHTAIKTRKLIQKALGGVLFIDEAYSLARGGEKDFGKEAIDTLVKALEDHKEELVVILAGYPREMDQFIEANPGLRSRFPVHLDFPDYSPYELVKIFKKMARERDYQTDRMGEVTLYRLIDLTKCQDYPNYGNARTMRNILEKAIRNQAIRLEQSSSLSREKLMTLTPQDLERGVSLCNQL